MSTQSLDLSIVIPCHNEEGNLRRLYRELREVLDAQRVSYEIVITDDGSSDGTWAVLKELALRDPRLRVQRLARNCGESTASWAGMRIARGSYILTIDADLQNDPRDIPRFLQEMKRYDFVCGTRVNGRGSGDNLVRRISSWIANAVRNRVTREQITDSGCTYRAFRRECLNGISPFDGMHRFLPSLICMNGFKVAEIEVANRPRVAGNAHYGILNRVFGATLDLMAVRWMKARIIRYEVAERFGHQEQVE